MTIETSISDITNDSFVYTEAATGGANKRGKVKRLEDVEPHGADHYTSLYGHARDFEDYVNDPATGRGVGSCRGYAGAVKPFFVPFDIDRTELADALRDTREFSSRLVEDYDVPADMLRFYFSGSKGFHVEVPAGCFDDIQASVNAPQKVKDLALRILDGIETDAAVYDRNRLWRSPNTINGKTGLYKIPLTFDELLNLGMDEIKELARKPRHVDHAMPEPVPYLVALKDSTNVTLRDEIPKITDEQTEDLAAVIQEFMPPMGERHLFARALAGYLIPRLKKPRTLAAMLDAWERVGYGDPETPQRITDLVENTAERYVNGENIEGGKTLDERAPGLPEAIKNLLSANGANGANSYSYRQAETPKFPVEAMPAKTRRFIRETAASIDCSVDLVAVPTLGALSAAIGQSREGMRSADYTQSAVLYLACIDEPGSGKSPAMSAATAPIKKRQQELKAHYETLKERYEDDLRQYEIDKKTAAKDGKAAPRPPRKPSFPRTWVDDTTIEALASRLEENPRGLYLIQDELTGWIKGFDQYKSGGKGSTRQKYLQIWSNETISVDRMGRDEPMIVERPFVTLYGGIQPRLLQEIADGRDDGFIDRFLLEPASLVGSCYPEVGHRFFWTGVRDQHPD
ncbi:MAG TPA: DUF3987 domain-containing protein [Rubrobacter sp.]|nr:DUF3987 domain-containing protein [Rubrobacter sp.]